LRLIAVFTDPNNGQPATYLRGTIAANLDWAFPNGFTAKPDPLLLAASLSQSGVGDDDTIVTYDDGNGELAEMLAHWLRHYGHERAYSLGGRREWSLRGLPLVAQPTRENPASYTVRIRDLALVDPDVANRSGRRSYRQHQKSRAA
jgi:3-mercaptopyruvate sulfurtransferase SseA